MQAARRRLTVGIYNVRLAHAQCRAVIAVLCQNGNIAVNGAADDASACLQGAAVRRDHRQMKGRRLPLLRFCEHVVDGAREQECALGQPRRTSPFRIILKPRRVSFSTY